MQAGGQSTENSMIFPVPPQLFSRLFQLFVTALPANQPMPARVFPPSAVNFHLRLKDHICKVCGVGFSHKPNLESHEKSVHLKLKEHVCQVCEAAFATREHLNRHKRSVHLQLKEHVCKECGAGSSSHEKCVHLKLKENVC